MKCLRLNLCIFLLLGLMSASAATLSTKVDPTQVTSGQAFYLTLDLDENAPAGLPDFTPLQHDFQINGTTHRASYMFIDGQSKASSSWTLTLTPKRTGKLTIPAIQVGQARSTPTSIEVTDTPNAPANTIHSTSTTALFIKTTANESKPFINQQVTYTVKIYHNTPILDASYQPPQLDDALSMPLGDNRQYQVIENGRPYLVEEQTYAFFPQQSGAHVLSPPSLQALIYDEIPRRVRADGTSKSLEIKPIPENFKNKSWIPAKSLAFTEHYDQHETTFSEGSTLIRTLTLRAIGLPAELLPPIHVSKSSDFNTYPEQPVLKTETQGRDIVGKTTVKISYLFNQAGSVTLPEQTITWFNTETGKTEHATLPKRTLHVIAQAQPQPQPQTQTPLDIETSTPKTTSATSTFTFKHALMLHFALLCAFSISLLFVFLIYLHRKHQHFIKARALKTLIKACRNNDPIAARNALFTWAKLIWPEKSLLNLNDIAQITSHAELSKHINILSAALYNAEQTKPWQGQGLLLALHQFTKNRRNRTKKTPKPQDLPPINPQS